MNFPASTRDELKNAYVKIGAELKEKTKKCSDGEFGEWAFRYVESFYRQQEAINENTLISLRSEKQQKQK